MSTKYACPNCDTKVVLVNSGGVWRDIICHACNREMKLDGSEETVWVHNDTSNDDSYQIDR